MPRSAAPVKRGAQVVAAEPETKRAKLSPLVSGVADAIGQADGLTKSCHAMLIAGLPGTLETPANERHEHQATFVSWVEDIMSGVHEKLKSKVDAAEEALLAADRTKGEFESKVSEAKAVLSQKQEAVEAQQADLAARSEAVQAAKAHVVEVQEAATKFNATLSDTRVEKEEVDGAMQGSICALTDVELFKAEEVSKHVSLLVPLARRLALDDSLLTALPSACAGSPDKRGSFDKMVIDQLRAHLDKRLAVLQEILDKAAGTIQEHTAAVTAAQEGLASASIAQQSAATELVKAQSEQAQAADAVAASEGSAQKQLAECLAATEARDKEAMALQNFTGYNMECFNTLRDQVARAAPGGA